MTLYEINEALKNALANMDPETGEILADLDGLELQRTEKIEGIALSIKNDTALMAAIKDEIEAMQKRLKTISGSVEWRKQYLANALTHEDGNEKFASPRVSIGWRKSVSVRIDDEVAFCRDHANYSKMKIDVKPDKDAIKTDLKKGVQISGAVLEERNNLQIR